MVNWIVFLILNSAAYAFVYEGSLLDSSGNPIAESGIKITAEIFDDGISCVLYERQFNLDLSDRNGHFSLDLSQGTAPSSGGHQSNVLAQILSNSDGHSVTCADSSIVSFNGSFVKRQIRLTIEEIDGVDVADITLPFQDLTQTPFSGQSTSVTSLAIDQVDSVNVKNLAITNEKIATGVDAAKLIGALPAIDGSNLTGIAASAIAADSIGASELENTAVSPGTYGSTSEVASFTVDAQGRIISATNITIDVPDGHSLDASDGAPVDALIVDANGNIGVGTSTPSTELEVNGVVTATTFSGSGSGLSGLDAANLSTGLVPPSRLGTGTPDGSTYLRGDGVWSTIDSGGTDVQIFTTSGTWTKPASGTVAYVECWGGGGGGGKGSYYGGGGGGGGAYVYRIFQLTDLGATEIVTVGAGGLGATSQGSGAAGSDSSFGAHMTAYSGAGGRGTSSSSNSARNGGGGGGWLSAGQRSSGTGGSESCGNGGGPKGGSNSNGPDSTYGGGGGCPGGMSIFGGGGGAQAQLGTQGGRSFYGGGGGGAARASFGGSNSAGGQSFAAGAGGDGKNTTPGLDGGFPSGGGGGTRTGSNGGNGGDGLCRVIVW